MFNFEPTRYTQSASHQQTKDGNSEDTKSDRQTATEGASADDDHRDRQLGPELRKHEKKLDG
jgi:hypothetical protein